MKTSSSRSTEAGGAGAGLILLGLIIAVLGAAMVMFLVVGVSCLYVARYSPAAMNLLGFTVTGAIFLRAYGPYLDRLERHAPMEPDSTAEEAIGDQPPAVPDDAGADESSRREPVATHVAIGLATGGYGALIVVAGIIFTRGEDRALNVLAGTALVLCALVIWRWARPSK